MDQLAELLRGWNEGKGSAGLHDALLEAGFPCLAAHVDKDVCGVGVGRKACLLFRAADGELTWPELEEDERRWNEENRMLREGRKKR